MKKYSFIVFLSLGVVSVHGMEKKEKSCTKIALARCTKIVHNAFIRPFTAPQASSSSSKRFGIVPSQAASLEQEALDVATQLRKRAGFYHIPPKRIRCSVFVAPEADKEVVRAIFYQVGFPHVTLITERTDSKIMVEAMSLIKANPKKKAHL